MIKAKPIALVVALAFGLTLANDGASVTGTQILIDDFHDGNDDGWSQYDYTAGESFGPATFEVINEAYHIASQGGHVAGDNILFALWDDSSSDAPFRNGYLQARVRADNPNTVAGITMRGTADENGRLNGYIFVASANFGVMVIARSDGSAANFITDLPNVGVGPGSDWFFKAGAIDNRLEFKVWRAGQSEPTSPQLTIPDSTYANGYLGVAAVQSGGSPNAAFGATFDEIQFIPDLKLADVNLDGEVNGLDVDPFVALVTGGTYQDEGDMNEDGVVNGLDVDPFVAAVVGGSAQEIPEPSTVLLALVALSVVCGWRKWGG